jgi:hypothetical protein
MALSASNAQRHAFFRRPVSIRLRLDAQPYARGHRRTHGRHHQPAAIESEIMQLDDVPERLARPSHKPIIRFEQA